VHLHGFLTFILIDLILFRLLIHYYSDFSSKSDKTRRVFVWGTLAPQTKWRFSR
jgi:hypothetical protein